MNILGDIHEIEDRLDEIGWLLRSIKADVRKGAKSGDLTTVVDDISYQAGQIEQIAQGLGRNLR